MLPLLKWPGGKRWFTARYTGILPTQFDRYIEPFLGSGAVYFELQPARAILGDINAELIAVYNGIKKSWPAVLRHLRRHQRKHSDRHYYAVRDSDISDPIERAARLIYLNRTCFNGIYRVNHAGRFNVPIGTKKSVLFDTDDFKAMARLLAKAQIRKADFEVLVNESRRGDLVFADPPYTVRHNNNAFVKYNEKLFSWNDQVRLAGALERARRRGVQIVATNANHASVRALYRGRGFQLTTVSRFSSISAAVDSRKQYEEVVIVGNVKGAFT
jgi:DNA adenine methylase